MYMIFRLFFVLNMIAICAIMVVGWGKYILIKPTPEKRKEMSEKSEYKNQYAAQNYDSLRIIVPKGCKDLVKAAATAKTGGSINGYVNQAINERLQKDGFPVMQRQEQEGAGTGENHDD